MGGEDGAGGVEGVGLERSQDLCKNIDQRPDHALDVMTDVNHLKCLCNNNQRLKKRKKSTSNIKKITKKKRRQEKKKKGRYWCKLDEKTKIEVQSQSGLEIFRYIRGRMEALVNLQYTTTYHLM